MFLQCSAIIIEFSASYSGLSNVSFLLGFFISPFISISYGYNDKSLSRMEDVQTVTAHDSKICSGGPYVIDFIFDIFFFHLCIQFYLTMTIPNILLMYLFWAEFEWYIFFPVWLFLLISLEMVLDFLCKTLVISLMLIPNSKNW